MIDLSSSPSRPKVGEVVNSITVVSANMVDEVGLRGGKVEVMWPVSARGKVR